MMMMHFAEHTVTRRKKRSLFEVMERWDPQIPSQR